MVDSELGVRRKRSRKFFTLFDKMFIKILYFYALMEIWKLCRYNIIVKFSLPILKLFYSTAHKRSIIGVEYNAIFHSFINKLNEVVSAATTLHDTLNTTTI